jgi:hypothetical protein
MPSLMLSLDYLSKAIDEGAGKSSDSASGFAFPRARRPACSREIGDLGDERECCRFDGLNERFDAVGPDDGRKPLLGALPVGPGPQELRLAVAGDREHAAAPIRSLSLLDPPVLQ